MKQKLLYSILLLVPSLCAAQKRDTLFVSPYINATSSIVDGIIEVGPEFRLNKIKTINEGGIIGERNIDKLVIRPSIRLPLTDKDKNSLQIDRFTATWRGILSFQYFGDYSTANDKTFRQSFTIQLEFGNSDFKYYPTGIKTNEQKLNRSSYAAELKYIPFFTKKIGNRVTQFSPQFRLRYAYDWKAADEVGVVNPINSSGVITTTNRVITAPNVNAKFSPAISLQFYPGKNDFSYSPTVYSDFTGDDGSKNPFKSLNRLRLETWIFYYPLVSGGIKIGVSPFLSIRTAGTDDFNKIEYGGVFNVKLSTSFLQFL